jgi:hypothetical protein
MKAILTLYCSLYFGILNERTTESPFLAEVCCKEQNKEGINFILRLTNFSSKSQKIPSHFFVSQMNVKEANIGYEVWYCGKDTVEVKSPWVIDPHVNTFIDKGRILFPQENTLIEAMVPKSMFEKQGTYKVRFILRKGLSALPIAQTVSAWEFISVNVKFE